MECPQPQVQENGFYVTSGSAILLNPMALGYPSLEKQWTVQMTPDIKEDYLKGQVAVTKGKQYSKAFFLQNK